MDQLSRLGKRQLICLLLFTHNYVVSVWRGFLFLWVLGMGYVILLWHSLSLPYNYFEVAKKYRNTKLSINPDYMQLYLYQMSGVGSHIVRKLSHTLPTAMFKLTKTHAFMKKFIYC